MPNGNLIVTTAYHFALLLTDDIPEPVIITMSSTQLKNSRRWLTTARGLKLNINGKLITPPMYSHIYEISTEKESNSKGTWYSYNISNPTILQNEQKHLYELGKSFNKESMTDLANLIPQKPNTEESLTQSTDTSVVDNTDAF